MRLWPRWLNATPRPTCPKCGGITYTSRAIYEPPNPKPVAWLKVCFTCYDPWPTQAD